MRKPQGQPLVTRNLEPATCLQPVTQMDPLLAKIRAQLPSETLSFGLLVRGEVLKEQLSAFTKLARATEESTHFSTDSSSAPKIRSSMCCWKPGKIFRRSLR